MSNKLPLNWQDIQHLVQEIARQIQTSGWKPDIVIGVDRGGLVPSVMLSHYLGIPHESIKVSLRDNVSTESLLWAPEMALEGKNILLVDDINDSGATQAWIRKDWADSVAGVDPCFDDNFWHDEIRWASLVDNEASVETSDFTGMSVNKMEQDVWIDFPWESWWNRSTI
jgi:hypoxanthine phosphoribosyltransferase